MPFTVAELEEMRIADEEIERDFKHGRITAGLTGKRLKKYIEAVKNVAFDGTWKVAMNYKSFNAWRQTRELEPGEPMHSGVRETRGCCETREEAQKLADELNAEMERAI